MSGHLSFQSRLRFSSAIPRYGVEPLEQRILLTGYAWNNAAGGGWNNSDDWTPNGIPGLGDSATISLPGTYTVVLSNNNPDIQSLVVGGAAGEQTLGVTTFAGEGSLTLENDSFIKAHGTLQLGYGANWSGNLYLSGNLTVDGTLTIGTTGGEINYGGGSGQITINSDATLNMNGDLYLGDGSDLINDGSAFWSSGTVHCETGGATVTNNGSIICDENIGIGFSADSGTCSFNNYGTLTVNGSSSFRSIGGATGVLNNIGTINVDGGTLSVRTGFTVSQYDSTGNSLNGGTWNVAAGAELDFPSGDNILANAGNVSLNGTDANFPALSALTTNTGTLMLADVDLTTFRGHST